MEDENNQNGHKKLIPPPFKIKILTDPPYRINLSQDEKNEDGADTQHNSNFVQAQVNEESNKLATTQNPVSTPSATTDANPSATKSEYALVKREEILPSKPDLSFMQQQPENRITFPTSLSTSMKLCSISTPFKKLNPSVLNSATTFSCKFIKRKLLPSIISNSNFLKLSFLLREFLFFYYNLKYHIIRCEG